MTSSTVEGRTSCCYACSGEHVIEIYDAHTTSYTMYPGEQLDLPSTTHRSTLSLRTSYPCSLDRQFGQDSDG